MMTGWQGIPTISYVTPQYVSNDDDVMNEKFWTCNEGGVIKNEAQTALFKDPVRTAQ